MTVPSTRFREDYAGNGSATSFPYAFRIFKATDLVVTKTDSSGNDTTLTLGTDYTVTGAGSYNGGAVVLSTALPTSYRLTIERVLAIRQDTDLRNQGEFLAETHEDAFDRLTMIVQRLAGYLGMGQGGTLRTLLLGTGDVDGAGAFRARGNRISGLGDPVDDTDAAGKRWTQEQIAGAVNVNGSSMLGVFAITIDTIAGASGLLWPDKATVIARGRDTVGDEGGGTLRFLKGSTATANGVTIYAINGGRLIREDWSVFGVNVKWAGTGAAAIQAAINAAGQNATIVYPGGEYAINSSITVLPQQKHIYNGSVFKVASGVQMYIRSTDGYPGRVSFDGIARFEGTNKTGRAISITNNTPFVHIGDHLHFENFGIPVLLDGSYSSYVGGTYVGNRFGPHLLNECHDSIINAKSDLNVETAACLNGNPVDGALGTIPVHNVTFIGYYQNTKHGLWLENCYETRIANVYHEGNTHSDVTLGVADGGAYARAAYHTVVDGWQSSSPCASGVNWNISHSVGANMTGVAFNSGTSSTATVFQVDGFSDQIDLDYQRVQHATIGTTAPFSVPAGRVIIRNNGASVFPFARKYIQLGPIGAPVGALWGTLTGGGRPTVQLESLGPNQDMTFKVQDIERHENSSGTSVFQIDHLNSRTDTAYLLRPATDNTLALGEVERRWSVVCAGSSSIVTSDERSKQDIEPIPQEWLDAWGDVHFVRYKFRDAVAAKGDGARWHVGVIAQRVKDAFEARGLDPFEIGILCYDSWDEHVDVDGKVHPAGELYGIRYEEALALECAYLRKIMDGKK